MDRMRSVDPENSLRLQYCVSSACTHAG
jgi:hypothetical protein